MDMKETEETAQVKSKKSNNGIIATDADSIVLHALPCMPISHVMYWHTSTSWSAPRVVRIRIRV